MSLTAFSTRFRFHSPKRRVSLKSYLPKWKITSQVMASEFEILLAEMKINSPILFWFIGASANGTRAIAVGGSRQAVLGGCGGMPPPRNFWIVTLKKLCGGTSEIKSPNWSMLKITLLKVTFHDFAHKSEFHIDIYIHDDHILYSRVRRLFQ